MRNLEDDFDLCSYSKGSMTMVQMQSRMQFPNPVYGNRFLPGDQPPHPMLESRLDYSV